MSKEESKLSNYKISFETKTEILTEHVEPAYKKDVKELIHGKRCWRLTGQTFETISKVFVAVGTIVSFAAGVYNETNLSFISGAISTFSLATLQFASFSYRENKKQSHELNTLLKNIDLEALPTMERSADDGSGASMRQTCTPLNKQNSINNITMPYSYYSEIINNYRQNETIKNCQIEDLKQEIEILNKQITNYNIEQNKEIIEEKEVKFHDQV